MDVGVAKRSPHRAPQSHQLYPKPGDLAMSGLTGLVWFLQLALFAAPGNGHARAAGLTRSGAAWNNTNTEAGLQQAALCCLACKVAGHTRSTVPVRAAAGTARLHKIQQGLQSDGRAPLVVAGLILLTCE